MVFYATASLIFRGLVIKVYCQFVGEVDVATGSVLPDRWPLDFQIMDTNGWKVHDIML